MSENEPEKPKASWGLLHWSVVSAVLTTCVFLAISWDNVTAFKTQQMKSARRALDLASALHDYAAEHNGAFPDARFAGQGERPTANVAFHELIKEGLVKDEALFGCPYSSLVPDGNLGEAPDFKQALEPGENHWMMVGGLNREAPDWYPLVLENAESATWPPRWQTPESGTSPWAGLAWRDHRRGPDGSRSRADEIGAPRPDHATARELSGKTGPTAAATFCAAGCGAKALIDSV